MRAAFSTRENLASVQNKARGEFNMVETSICAGSVDFLYEKGLEEATVKWAIGVSSGDKFKD